MRPRIVHYYTREIICLMFNIASYPGILETIRLVVAKPGVLEAINITRPDKTGDKLRQTR